MVALVEHEKRTNKCLTELPWTERHELSTEEGSPSLNGRPARWPLARSRDSPQHATSSRDGGEVPHRLRRKLPRPRPDHRVRHHPVRRTGHRRNHRDFRHSQELPLQAHHRADALPAQSKLKALRKLLGYLLLATSGERVAPARGQRCAHRERDGFHMFTTRQDIDGQRAHE